MNIVPNQVDISFQQGVAERKRRKISHLCSEANAKLWTEEFRLKASPV